MQTPPTEEELAAIVAAIEAMQPVPVETVPERPPARRSAWHFSGRWWMGPVPVRRARPFL